VSASSTHELRSIEPAERWVEAYPLGNGFLGAMCHGGIREDAILLNHGTVWSGDGATVDPHPVDAESARRAIREAEERIGRGKHADAEAALRTLQYSYPQSFLPLARLVRKLSGSDADASGYERVLDLRNAECRTGLASGRILQSVFVSSADDVLVVHVTGVERGVEFELTTPLRVESVAADADDATMICRAPDDVLPSWGAGEGPVRYADDPAGVRAALVVRADGAVLRADDDRIAVRADSDQVVVVIAVETTFVGSETSPTRPLAEVVLAARSRASDAARRDVGELRARHRDAHRELYGRAELILPEGAESATVTERLAAVQRGDSADASADPALLALLFHLGRYLLISSSRPGGLPANLQGIWNAEMQPPWSSDYTLNINLEMNYWLAETTDLSECVEPLERFIGALAERGGPTARRLYDAAGWVAHQCSDAWAYGDPVGDGTHDVAWAFWPMAGPWLVAHLWERYRFGGRVEDLERSWPVIRGAAEFVLSWMTEREDGRLGFALSTSPENRFLTDEGRPFALAPDATMDLALAKHLMGVVVEAAGALEIDDDVAARAAAARDRLPDPTIGADGLVEEWRDLARMEDPHHRHMAHLVFVHPLDGTPDGALADAARRSLDARGDESTGWSLAWKAAMRARLRQPDAVDRLLDLFVRTTDDTRAPDGGGRWRGGLYPNLFSAHPPFQIDGNLGIVAALAECLVQSHRGVIELLPAVPRAMRSGSVRGLRARGGVAVDLAWRDGHLESARIRNAGERAAQLRVVYGGRELSVHLAVGEERELAFVDPR